MSTRRLNELRQRMKAENLDGIIVTELSQVRYLTGFTGSAGLLVVLQRGADFFTDSRYTLQAGKQVKGAKVHTVKGGLITSLADFAQLHARNRRYGVTWEFVTLQAQESLRLALHEALFTNADPIMKELGWVKEKPEIDFIRKAVRISDIAFGRIIQLVRPGIAERELAAELEYQMMMLGSERPAFETIVASGYRSAMPHGTASSKKLGKGEFVTFDFGATVSGYVSDITRTVVIGKATSRQKKVYAAVAKSQLVAINKVKPGISGRLVDSAARTSLQKAGFGKYFSHGTGHGIGFIIHTGPRVSPLADDKLKTGNVITIEPGVYIEKWGGVRIEDDVLVTRSGHEVLNKAEKKLLEL